MAPGTFSRTPFRAPATPPTSATRSPSPFPESPTNLRPAQNFPRPPAFSLDHRPKYSLPVRKFARSPRRVLLAIALLGLVAFLAQSASRIVRQISQNAGWLHFWDSHAEPDDGLCKFVSPVEAYHRDLARLRALHGLASTSPAYSHLGAYKNHHTYSPTGHLIVSDDEDAPHPIPTLLDLGEKRWAELLSRQSRTIEEAYREYVRRYGRHPPKGFDKWWEFATDRNLVLPDEYDRINLDLAPFLALPKEEMKRRMEMVDQMAETFTLVIQNGTVEIEIKDQKGLDWGGTLPRAKDTSNLLGAFAQYLPDMRATFSIFDQPQIYLSWARRGSLINLGLRGEHTTHLHETDSAKVKLSRSCAPDSNYRQNGGFSEGKSFIYDSLEAGDLCQNPYLIPLHGLTIEPHEADSHPRPHTQLLPLFSLAKTSINSDILITPLDQFHDGPGEDLEWDRKTSSKLAWRGSSTGISWMTKDLDWRSAHRIRLHQYANNQSTEPLRFIVPEFGQDALEEEEEDDLDDYHPEDYIENENLVPPQGHQHAASGNDAEGESGPLKFFEGEMRTDEAMEWFYDIKLAGGPIQCSPDDGTCLEMMSEITWASRQSGEDLNKNKFLLDIDGNGWSGRFRKLMSTNSVVIKMTMFTEWFQPHLIPWFMYIPAKLDFSDLPDIMAFFRGTPDHPDLGFDETAQALARNGQCFVQRMFRMEDLEAYMMRLFLEYARIAADEGQDMDFYLPEAWSDLDADWDQDPSVSQNKKKKEPVMDLPDVTEDEVEVGMELKGHDDDEEVGAARAEGQGEKERDMEVGTTGEREGGA